MKLYQNIKKNYRFSFLNSLNVTHGIWMLYLASKGLNLFEIGLMEALYHISSFSFEVPTGAIADLWGRKASRVLGRVVSLIAILCILYGQNIFWFGISFILQALSNTLESGAGDALVYDTLKSLGKEEEYISVRGKQEVLFQLASMSSLLLGGYVAMTDYHRVYQIAFLITVFSLLQALTFMEPPIEKTEKKENLWHTFSHQIKESVSVIHGEKKIIFLILFLELFSALFTTEFFYIQNLLKGQGYTEVQIGLVLALGGLFAAMMAYFTPKIEKRIKEVGILTIIPLLAVLGFWGMTMKGIEPYAFVFLAMMEGILFVCISDYLNRLIPSKQRATVLSFQSMAFSIIMILIFPLVGKLGDGFGLQSAFILVAIMATISLSSISCIGLWKERKKKYDRYCGK